MHGAGRPMTGTRSAARPENAVSHHRLPSSSMTPSTDLAARPPMRPDAAVMGLWASRIAWATSVQLLLRRSSMLKDAFRSSTPISVLLRCSSSSVRGCRRSGVASIDSCPPDPLPSGGMRCWLASGAASPPSRATRCSCVCRRRRSERRIPPATTRAEPQGPHPTGARLQRARITGQPGLAPRRPSGAHRPEVLGRVALLAAAGSLVLVVLLVLLLYRCIDDAVGVRPLSCRPQKQKLPAGEREACLLLTLPSRLVCAPSCFFLYAAVTQASSLRAQVRRLLPTCAQTAASASLLMSRARAACAGRLPGRQSRTRSEKIVATDFTDRGALSLTMAMRPARADGVPLFHRHGRRPPACGPARDLLLKRGRRKRHRALYGRVYSGLDSGQPRTASPTER